MPRHFNVAGPCDPRRNYMLPPERRLPDMLRLVEEEAYFVLHAPRQTGKTTAMRAFAARLRERGKVAVHATLETSQSTPATVDAEPRWLWSVAEAAGEVLPPADRPPPPASVDAAPPGERLRSLLSAWSEKVAPRPVVLILDEADVVTGQAMIDLLRQLRAGFPSRPEHFPSSVVLVGMRDLRDYLTEAKGGAAARVGSPFNVKAASLTLRGFTAAEVGELYAQHTADTGQAFAPEAVSRAWELTQGQPFLVNALARICVRDLVPDTSEPVLAAHVDAAKEALILSRTTHLDSLAERLKEPRVARIVQAVFAGDLAIPYDHDDFQYVEDLGLLVRGRGGAEAANPVYREVLARQVTYNLQHNLRLPSWRWSTPDGRLDFPALIGAFGAWWRENADALVEDVPDYPEAIPHLSLMAFLQRVVNGGGSVAREYAAGRGALDLLVTYGPDRFAVEVKRVRARDGLDRVRAAGIGQLSAYLDQVGLSEGWLYVFDQRPGRTWAERTWTEEVEHEGRRLHLVGG